MLWTIPYEARLIMRTRSYYQSSSTRINHCWSLLTTMANSSSYHQSNQLTKFLNHQSTTMILTIMIHSQVPQTSSEASSWIWFCRRSQASSSSSRGWVLCSSAGPVPQSQGLPGYPRVSLGGRRDCPWFISCLVPGWTSHEEFGKSPGLILAWGSNQLGWCSPGPYLGKCLRTKHGFCCLWIPMINHD